MKWREVQEPHTSPILAPGATPAILSPGQEREKDTNPMSDMDEKRLSQQTVEAASQPGSATSTPKPSSRKSLAHVLIVDDNEINVTVGLIPLSKLHANSICMTLILAYTETTQILATFMRKISCSFDTASNGLIALERYKSSLYHYDFILMGTFSCIIHLIQLINI
jgi:hypothetical protein